MANPVLLSAAANELMQKRLNAYVEAMQIIVAALGLDPTVEWRYDATLGALVAGPVAP